MDRKELIMNDGYWDSKIELLLNHQQKKRKKTIRKEILKLKNELISLLSEGNQANSENDNCAISDVVWQSEQLICPHCGKYKRMQGNGIMHQLCECSSEVSVCINCDQEKETYSICSDCLTKIINENKQTDC